MRVRAAEVRALVLDVDGVLTDGTLYYGADGEHLKAFHVRDGLGLRLLRQEGIVVAVISAKGSDPLVRRLRDLKVEHALLGREDKPRALRELCARVAITEKEVAYIGDDILDLPVLARVGLAITVADGHPLVRQRVQWITEAAGGSGAVREVADGLLDARGRLEASCVELTSDISSARADR